MSNKTDYDVIIIGAGISGLVCGCYLAKAGMKTLIVEKNANPGGYCTSFTRKGFTFDACVHGLSSFRQGGILDKFMSDLSLVGNLKIKKHNPSDVIITPDAKINIFHDINKTIDEFQRYFPRSKNNIKMFFEYLAAGHFLDIRNKTFGQLTDQYFTDKKIKGVLSIITLMLFGYDPTLISATAACLLWKEFMLDGGYYPEGNIQSFPDLLIEKFKKLGGKVIFYNEVRRIMVEHDKARSVVLNDGQDIFAKYIISACDVRQTFFKLIDRGKISDCIISNTASLKPSLSAFIVYLGVENLGDISKFATNMWVINSYNVNAAMSKIQKFKNDFFVIASPCAKNNISGNDKITLSLSTISLFKNVNYWTEANKNKFANRLLSKAEKIIPGLKKKIIFKAIATPATLNKWTYNHNGSAYGWASIPSQFANSDVSQKTNISNLYFTGHWSNLSSGVASVVNCARNVAGVIVQQQKYKTQ